MNKDQTIIPNADLACTHFQYLEDLATGYWYSEVLFAALELRIFDRIEDRPLDTTALARQSRCHAAPLDRLLEGLEVLGLVRQHQGTWFNSQVARMYLLSHQPSYMGDFLLYRRYLRDPWRGLARCVAEDPAAVTAQISSEDSYTERNRQYVRSLDALARRKAEEIFDALAREIWSGPVLDVGGGAGALSRRALRRKATGFAVLIDLPEVLAAGREIYPQSEDWKNLHPVAWDIRGRFPFSGAARFGLVILSNILHAYNAPEAQALLNRAAGCLRAGGLLLIHDYFPDAPANAAKGVLYDLNMMLNTYDGRCHRIADIKPWLTHAGFDRMRLKTLPSDSGLILAGGSPAQGDDRLGLEDLVFEARRLGFTQALPMSPQDVVTADWVRVKCRFGCQRYGQDRTCPPHGRDAVETAALMRSYRKAILLEGEPPGSVFHSRLLKMEKRAFLAGYHKALGFGAGPCSLCESCTGEEVCRFPEKARPSMEASGIDVYGTARAAGLDLAPVTRPGDYVKYIGLLLLE